MTEQFDIYERLYRTVYPPEIHGGEDRILLSQSKCKYLTKSARVCRF